MTIYVEDPAQTPIQGIWLFRPVRGTGPAYRCRQAVEGFTIRDVASAQRYFRDVVKWHQATVRMITGVRHIDPGKLRPVPLLAIVYTLTEQAHGWPVCEVQYDPE